MMALMCQIGGTTMGNNGNGLVAKWNEFNVLASEKQLTDTPEYLQLAHAYKAWYESDEDDGTKIPKAGGSKYLAGCILHDMLATQIAVWSATNNSEEETTMTEQKPEQSTNDQQIKLTKGERFKNAASTTLAVGSVYAAIGTVEAGKAIKVASVETAKFTKEVAVPLVKDIAKDTKSKAKLLWAAYRAKR